VAGPSNRNENTEDPHRVLAMHTPIVLPGMTPSTREDCFSFYDKELVHLRCSTLKCAMGVDWHSLAIKLPQICPMDLTGKLRL
jgi:hypothetical protein